MTRQQQQRLNYLQVLLLRPKIGMFVIMISYVFQMAHVSILHVQIKIAQQKITKSVNVVQTIVNQMELPIATVKNAIIAVFVI
jgi:hypothetical protein